MALDYDAVHFKINASGDTELLQTPLDLNYPVEGDVRDGITYGLVTDEKTGTLEVTATIPSVTIDTVGTDRTPEVVVTLSASGSGNIRWRADYGEWTETAVLTFDLPRQTIGDHILEVQEDQSGAWSASATNAFSITSAGEIEFVTALRDHLLDSASIVSYVGQKIYTFPIPQQVDFPCIMLGKDARDSMVTFGGATGVVRDVWSIAIHSNRYQEAVDIAHTVRSVIDVNTGWEDWSGFNVQLSRLESETDAEELEFDGSEKSVFQIGQRYIITHNREV